MTKDRSKLPDELGDLDWGSALDEWEKSTLVTSAGECPQPTLLVEPPTRAPLTSLQNLSGEGTVIAQVPPELREQASRRPSNEAPALGDDIPSPSDPRVEAPKSALPTASTSSAPSASGGLGQLFAKGASQRPPLRPPSAKIRAVAPRGNVAETDEQPQNSIPFDSETFVADRPIGGGGGESDEDTLARAGVPEASSCLVDAANIEFRERAAWFEEEARATENPHEKARGLLGVSELRALLGESVEALRLATEARDVARDVALTWRQVRQLTPPHASDSVEALDAEATHSPTPAARAHSMLLAADILRMRGDGDSAVERWNRACKLDPADVRAPAARAALALAQGNHTSAGTDLAENSELIALDRAVATVLMLRGAPRAGTDIDAMPVTRGLRRARTALLGKDAVTAAQALADVAAEPSLTKSALWLSAALGSTHVGGRRGSVKALRTLLREGEVLASRPLAARAMELKDPDVMAVALANAGPFEVAEYAVLLAFAAQPPGSSLDALAKHERYAPLVDALSALALPSGVSDAAVTRARRTVGRKDLRGLASLGRLLASKPTVVSLDEALSFIVPTEAPSAMGVGLEVAILARRWSEVSEALASTPTSDLTPSLAQRYVAAALVAERTGDRSHAIRAWRDALANGATHDFVLRAIAALDDQPSRSADLGGELLEMADQMDDGNKSAVLRLEGLARLNRSASVGHKPLDADEQLRVLERVHRDAPTLGIAAFLGEQIGRRKGDTDEVLRWIRARRPTLTDGLEHALDAVREAFLVAESDAELASACLEKAQRERPDDTALRDLFEHLASAPPKDSGAWREQQAATKTKEVRAQLLIEAALAFGRAGDFVSSLRAARGVDGSADLGSRRFARVVASRAELQTGDTSRQSAELVELANVTDSDSERTEAFERLAELDSIGEKDEKDEKLALEWHTAILERTPRHLPSLRAVEQRLIAEGRDEELPRIFEQIALALEGTAGGEVAGHAQAAARFKTRTEAGWERTHDIARLAATQPDPSLWALRQLNAHARAQNDDETLLSTTNALLERTQRSPERATLLLRASEAAARLGRLDDASRLLEHAATEDPGDVVTWGFLAEVRAQRGQAREAAEACESLARASAVPDHQVLAWFDAARLWLDEVKDTERGLTALEQCAELDVTHGDVVQRLEALYTERHLDAELARLLEKRLVVVKEDGERIALEVELARALGQMGELSKAKASLESALARSPDHATALAAMADLCAREGDWLGVEQAYVRLARLLDTPEEQRAIYEKLGELYSVHTVNLSRAEVAYREVVKRAPGDVPALEKLIDIYKRQGDIARAIETQQEVILHAIEPSVRLQRLIDLARIHETAARDVRRSEQVLESARKEFPTSVVALRAMAEFYTRQRQLPAMHILLDRAAGDARRSFVAGRFVTSLFEILHAAYDLRGLNDAARVVSATLHAVEGPNLAALGRAPAPKGLVGGDARAIDPRLDELLAPELLGSALRALFHRAGDTLDEGSQIDLRAWHAAPLVQGTPLGTAIGGIATVVGLGALQIWVSPQLANVAIPLRSTPPMLLVGEGLATTSNEQARVFVIVRALKLILARASALVRGQPDDVAVLVCALFTALNPKFTPQGADAKKVALVSRRLASALPRSIDPTVGVIALEAAGTLGADAAMLGPSAQAWANRVALLAVGDPSSALDAIAWSKGEPEAPRDPEARAAWIARTTEARELMTFSVTDAYAEARARLGLDR